MAQALAIEGLALGLSALSVYPSSKQTSGGLSYVPVKMERRLEKEPRPYTRRYVWKIFGAGSEGGFGNDFAQVHFTVEVDANACGEFVALVSHSLEGSTSFSYSSMQATFTCLGLFPFADALDTRGSPARVAYQGSYDKMGNGHWDFKGQFEFNAFGYFKILRHNVVSRSLADWALSGRPSDYVYRFNNQLTWRLPPLGDSQRRIAEAEVQRKETRGR